MSDTVAVEVRAPGLLTTVQDTSGRAGWERFGLATGGALAPHLAAVANRLVGNPTNAPVLEITLAGPTLAFGGTTVFALAGADLGARLDGQPVQPGWSWLSRAGSVLTFGGRRSGARTYLAIAGGFDVPRVMGSAATDLRAGLGGIGGRALQAGDRLLAPRTDDVVARAGQFSPDAATLPASPGVRVLPGPHVERFEPGALDALYATEWVVSPQADRMGYRLDGPPLRHRRGADVASLGLPVGAIQVPGDGRPIVLLADHQPTGGYTVLACVIRADLPLLAQRTPGDRVRFTPTTVSEAVAELRRLHAESQATWADSDPPAIRWAEAHR